MFDRYFPEVNPLNERPVETLRKEGWNEILLNSVLHILQMLQAVSTTAIVYMVHLG